MLRVRWLGVLFSVGQILTYYRPYPPHVEALAFALAGLLLAGNTALFIGAKHSSALKALRIRGVLGLALDTVVVIGFTFIFAFDAGTAIWALIYILPLEGAIWFRMPGAVAAMVAASVGYTARELFAAAVHHMPLLPSSITFRMGIGFIIAAVAGAMASSLVRDRDDLARVNDRLKREIDERSRAEAELEAAQRIAHLGSWQWHVPTNTVTWSDELYRLFGLDPGEFEGTYEAYLRRVHPEERPTVETAVQRAVETGAPFSFDHRVILPDGDYRWLQATGRVVQGEPGAPILMMGTALDITARRRAEEALIHQAGHDPLTGLPNRTLLIDRLTQMLARRTRTPAPVAVLFMDLDRFKTLNDSFGHAAGDRLLVELAARMTNELRPGDSVARFGGDEFVIICEDTDQRGASQLANRIGNIVSIPVEYEDTEISPSISIGIAIAEPRGSEAAGDLLRDADAAMYRAKELGGNRRQVFAEGMRAHAHVMLTSESELRRSIEREQIEVFYQPEIDLQTGTIVGLEALARWHHPNRGAIPPGEFVPLAESSGLIISLGNAVLRRACRDVAAWQRLPGLSDLGISVNISARQLMSPGLEDSVRSVLEESGLAPSTLSFEITESVLLADLELNVSALRSLKSLGVRVVVDDFGTGYSSLTYLRQFPVDLLKIDKSFVEGLGVHPADRAIVAGVVHLAHAFGISSVAEGVETAEQLGHLRALGCEAGQGYLWSAPLSADEVPGWLAKHSPARQPA